ncbi:helix-turn-helix domain-containing protein [Nocardia brasiliensis]|uniref:MmyB family transcriptional regulator n=1 Tax=Nocardia brasiliensis TaxID=37326 RepID=UPI00366AE6E5
MRQTQTGRSRGNSKSGPPVSVPSLPDTLRRIREQRKLSRARAYGCHGVSPSYLFDLERGEYKPSLDMLEQIIAGYAVDASLARHLRDLRAPSVELVSTEELRLRVTADSGLMAHIQNLKERGVLAAYMSPVWNVLVHNGPLGSTLPGLDDVRSLLAWVFGPHADTAAVDRDRDAALAVATLRGVLGRYRHAEQSFDVLRKLGDNNDFRRRWTSSLEVSYACDSSKPVRLRHVGTGELMAYSLMVSEVPDTTDVLLMTALRKH